MEQNPTTNDVIVDWLADYSHYICDRFNIPHTQAGGILQDYLELTARGPPQQPVASPYQQPTSYPKPSNPHHKTHLWEQHPNSQLPTRPQTPSPSHSKAPTLYHETHFRDQPSSPHPAARFQTLPLSYSEALNPLHKTHNREEAAQSSKFMALASPDATYHGLFTPHEAQLGDMIPINSNLSETGAPSPQQTQPVNQTPIGNIKDYDPLWVQHKNEDRTAVEDFSSDMKFDTLFSAGVIKVGDVLTFQVSIPSNGQTLETEALLTV